MKIAAASVLLSALLAMATQAQEPPPANGAGRAPAYGNQDPTGQQAAPGYDQQDGDPYQDDQGYYGPPQDSRAGQYPSGPAQQGSYPQDSRYPQQGGYAPAGSPQGAAGAPRGAAAQAEQMQSVRGFSGMLLVTSDADWQRRWESARETAPNFTQANAVHTGGKLYFLTLFSNPSPDAQGNVQVECDVSVTRPDGSSSLHEADACAAGRLGGDPALVYLGSSVTAFAAEATDQRGNWKVDITLRDKVRGAQLPLHATFKVE